MKLVSILACGGLLAILNAPVWGQTPTTGASSQAGVRSAANVSRTAKAVNYRRSGKVTIGFQGTELMPVASGEARVENKGNRTEIDAKFEGFEEATKFGLEYLTYVFWAISPEGRAVNLGEVVLKNGASQVKAITDMQTFGMAVTAEPYFAVTQPGNMVVLENTLGLGKAENIEAKYELLGRGAYSSSNTKIENAIFGVDRKTPLELFEARNAVRIAHVAQADKYAASSMAKAEQQLKAAEDVYSRGSNRKTVEAAAREAVQTAEEARVMAAKLKAEDDAQAAVAAEKLAAEERAAKARAEAEAEARRREEAEQARQQAEAAKAEAERMKQEAEAAAQQAAQAKAAAEAEAEKARQLAAQAEAEKAQLRAQLLGQLNSILQTRDTARGLIVNMSDVLFDTGSYTLKPGAREKLARISGILLAHPGLTLEVEGHTDSVGSDEFNQQLSEHRAGSVRDYLVQSGVPDSTITARGFGKTQPVASNDTPEGRQKNRRVELVVNGEAIGGGASPAASATTPK